MTVDEDRDAVSAGASPPVVADRAGTIGAMTAAVAVTTAGAVAVAGPTIGGTMIGGVTTMAMIALVATAIGR